MTHTNDREPWQVIGRGKCAWHAEVDGRRLSGAHKPDELAAEAENGAFVYDAKDADYDAFSALVIGGPMLNLTLPPNGVQRLSSETRRVALAMAPALGGEFRSLALACQDEKFGGLDYVGIGVYEALLRRVPGVRFGRVRNGTIAWEEVTS